jgi:hypothetical protein
MHIVDTEVARREMIEHYALLLDKGRVFKFSGVEGAEGRRRYVESDAPLIGSPGQLISPLRRLADGGADLILLADMSGSTTGLRSFAHEIMPTFDPRTALVDVA